MLRISGLPCRRGVSPRWNRREAVSALLLLFLFASSAFADPTMEIKASRDKVYLGESFLLEIKVGGANPSEAPDLTQIQDCRITLLGSQDISHQSIIIVNGRIQREGFVGRSYTYKLTPMQAGKVETGPVTVGIDGKKLAGTGPAITVTGVEQQDIVSISVSASQDTVLVDEPFEIQVNVRIRGLPGVYADTDPLIPSAAPNLNVPFMSGTAPDGLKGPDIRTLLNGRLVGGNQPGFTLNDYTVQNDPSGFGFFLNSQSVPARFRLDRHPLTGNGAPSFEYRFTLTYTGEAEGAYTFGPVVFKGSIPTNVNDQGVASSMEIFAVGPAAIVRVVPPPEADRPESYIGAIGSNLTVTAALDAQTCRVGDPLELTLSIGGGIQMNNIHPPKLGLQTNLVDRFDVYDDTVKTAKRDGQRQYIYTLRPRQAGAFELPAIEASYYDAALRRYRTVTTVPIPLKVRQAREITASQVIGGSTNTLVLSHKKEEAGMRPAGMRLDPYATEPAGHTVTGVLLFATGPVVFLAVWLTGLYRRHSPGFNRALRQRKAFSRACRRLQAVPADRKEIHTYICQTLRQYISDRLEYPTESATPGEVRQLLIASGIVPDLAGRFAEIMQAHFDAAFSKGADPDITLVKAVVAKVEQAWSKRRPKPFRHSAFPTLLLLAVGLLALNHPAFASPIAEQDFILNEANSRLTSAVTPSDFQAAASVYQKLIDRGVRNSTVFFNQGTALLLAEKYADAVQVLLRAERYEGSAPDIRRNLAIALGCREGLKKPLTPWTRVVLFWHYGLAHRTRLLIVSLAFSLFWLAGALRLAGKKSISDRLALLALGLLTLFGSSVLTTLQQENNARPPPTLVAR